MNWDDVADLADGDKDDIPAEVQDKLLSDYERELIAEKMKKSSSAAATALSDEIAELALKDEEAEKRKREQQQKQGGEDGGDLFVQF